jgi:hypothetical protein
VSQRDLASDWQENGKESQIAWTLESNIIRSCDPSSVLLGDIRNFLLLESASVGDLRDIACVFLRFAEDDGVPRERVCEAARFWI